MRTIKFRAWDDKKKEWLLGDFSLFGEIMVMGEWSGILNTYLFDKHGCTFDDLKVMQFIGLLDKNGKEIYEGDIVQYEEAAIIDGGSVFDTGEVFYRVDNIIGWAVRWKRVGTKSLFVPFGGEIIGNIYENPELLK